MAAHDVPFGARLRCGLAAKFREAEQGGKRCPT
jgi:hypothetical protein